MRATLRNLGADWTGDAATNAGATLQRAAHWSHDAGASHGIGGETVGGYGESFEFVRGQVHWDDPWAWGWNDTASAAASVATLNPAPFLGNLTADYYTTAQANRTNDAAAIAALRAHEKQARTAVITFPSIQPPPMPHRRRSPTPAPVRRGTSTTSPIPPVAPAGAGERRLGRGEPLAARGRCRRGGRGRTGGHRPVRGIRPGGPGIGRRRAVHRPGRDPWRADRSGRERRGGWGRRGPRRRRGTRRCPEAGPGGVVGGGVPGGVPGTGGGAGAGPGALGGRTGGAVPGGVPGGDPRLRGGGEGPGGSLRLPPGSPLPGEGRGAARWWSRARRVARRGRVRTHRRRGGLTGGAAGGWRDVIGRAPTEPGLISRGPGAGPEFASRLPSGGAAGGMAGAAGMPFLGGMGVGAGGQSTEHRNTYWVRSAEPFDVPLPPHVDGGTARRRRMIPEWSRATVLAAAAFEVCWEVLDLGETPWQLEPPRRGLTAAERQAFVAEVTAQLRAAGPELPAWLRLLARPAWSVDVRLRADALVAGLVAGRGPVGVLAVRHDDEIALVDVPAAAAVDAVLGLLGPVRPGPGRPASVVLADGPTAPEVRAACQDVRMFGQLGASVLDREGVRTRRLPRVIGFHRTGAGDYRSVRLGPTTVALEPATHARLAADLHELLAHAH